MRLEVVQGNITEQDVDPVVRPSWRTAYAASPTGPDRRTGQIDRSLLTGCYSRARALAVAAAVETLRATAAG